MSAAVHGTRTSRVRGCARRSCAGGGLVRGRQRAVDVLDAALDLADAAADVAQVDARGAQAVVHAVQELVFVLVLALGGVAGRRRGQVDGLEGVVFGV